MTIESILVSDIGVRAAEAQLAIAPGQSLTLRSVSPGSAIWMIDIVPDFVVSATISVRSPRMHDNIRGIQANVLTTNPRNSLLNGIKQKMIEQDNLQIIGGVGGGAITWDNCMVSIFYENLIGAPGNLFTWDGVKDRIRNLMTIPFATAAGVVGSWENVGAFNNINDLTKSNTNYAILGAYANTLGMIVGISGPCTGNVIMGIPIFDTPFPYSVNYLKDLSILTGLATIPVFNSADKGATFAWIADPDVIGVGCTLLCAELEGQ